MRGAMMRAVAGLTVASLVLAACAGEDDGSTDDQADDQSDEQTDEQTDDATDEEEDAGGDDGAEPEALDVDALLEAGDDCEEPDGDPLRIGYAADLSEVGGYADGPGSQAAQFMGELINCAGGIGGTPVEVIVEDIQGDPDVTQRAAQDLLDQDVHAILGPPFSDFGLPLLQIVNRQVPVVFVASTEAALSDAEGRSFLVAFDDDAQSAAAGDFAREQGWETAVTLSSPDAPYFEQNPERFAEVFEEGGGELIEDFSYSLEDSDFSSQVNQIAALDPQPDVIYTAMIMPLTGTLLGQLRSAGVESEVIGADSFDATGVIAAGEDAEGVYYTTHGYPGEGSRMEAFLDAYEASEGEALETVSFGTLAADAMLLVADAYARAGALDPEAIGDEIAATQDLELVTETVSYPEGSGTPDKPVFIHRIEDGELTNAGTVMP